MYNSNIAKDKLLTTEPGFTHFVHPDFLWFPKAYRQRGKRNLLLLPDFDHRSSITAKSNPVHCLGCVVKLSKCCFISAKNEHWNTCQTSTDTFCNSENKVVMGRCEASST